MCHGPVARGSGAHVNEFNRVPGARPQKGKRNMVYMDPEIQEGTREGRNLYATLRACVEQNY